MAKTADYVVKKVLDSLVVGAAEASLPAVDAQNIIDYMNDYMFSIDALGIKLGYTEVTNISQVLTVSAGAIRGIISNVAMAGYGYSTIGSAPAQTASTSNNFLNPSYMDYGTTGTRSDFLAPIARNRYMPTGQ